MLQKLSTKTRIETVEILFLDCLFADIVAKVVYENKDWNFGAVGYSAVGGTIGCKSCLRKQGLKHPHVYVFVCR